MSDIFSCNICPETTKRRRKPFQSRSEFNQHLKTHTKPYLCPSCPNGFALNSDLIRHKRALHQVGNERYTCTICQKQLTRKDNLRTHVKKKHPNAPKPGVKLKTAEPDTREPLPNIWSAASAGNIGIIRHWIDSGVDVSTTTADDGSTMLHCAARAGQTETVQYLLQQGADTTKRNKAGHTPFFEAISGGSTETMETLLLVEKDPGLSFLEKSIFDSFKANSLAVVDALLVKYQLQCHNSDPRQDGPQEEQVQKYPQDILHHSAAYGHVTLTKHLLGRATINVNRRIRWTYDLSPTPLYLAASNGHTKVVDLLLSHDGLSYSPKSTGKFTLGSNETAIRAAAANGHLEIVQSIVEYNNTSLTITTGNKRTPVEFLISSGYVEFLRSLIDQKYLSASFSTETYGRKPLHRAAAKGQVEMFKFLLSLPGFRLAWTSDHGYSVLHCAVSCERHESLEMVRFLLSHKDIDVNARADYGDTALHVAAKTSHVEMVKLLLGYSDINSVNRAGRTAFHLAAEYDNIETVKLLLGHPDLNVRATCKIGYTALHNACCRWEPSMRIIELLLTCIDINARSNYGKTALDLARRRYGYKGRIEGYKERIEWLVKHGAKTGKELDEESNVASADDFDKHTNGYGREGVRSGQGGTLQEVMNMHQSFSEPEDDIESVDGMEWQFQNEDDGINTHDPGYL